MYIYIGNECSSRRSKLLQSQGAIKEYSGNSLAMLYEQIATIFRLGQLASQTIRAGLKISAWMKVVVNALGGCTDKRSNLETCKFATCTPPLLFYVNTLTFLANIIWWCGPFVIGICTQLHDQKEIMLPGLHTLHDGAINSFMALITVGATFSRLYPTPLQKIGRSYYIWLLIKSPVHACGWTSACGLRLFSGSSQCFLKK